MNTLTVADIFKNFAFYQAEYPSILNNPEQYQTIVTDAVLDVWPTQRKTLHLGDLLKLWFNQKWLVNLPCALQIKDKAFPQVFNPTIQKDDLYLYELHGNAVFGKGKAKAWSVSEQKILEIEVESSLQYYCTYKAL